MLGLSELRQTRFFQEAQQEKAVSLVMRQLALKCGKTPPDLEVKIQQLSPGKIDELAEALLGFSAIADLEVWLQTQIK